MTHLVYQSSLFYLNYFTSIHAARDKLGVIVIPQHLSHLAVVAFQIESVLKSGRRVDLNDVAVYSGEEMTSVGKGTLNNKQIK